MATATTLLKIAALMIIVSFQTTVCDTQQSQEPVLIWNVVSLTHSTSNTFRFNATLFTKFFACLCREDTHDCTIARSSSNGQYTVYNMSKSGSFEYEKAYECYLIGAGHNAGIYCPRLSQGKNTMPLMCITYKYLSQVPKTCDEDTVEIMSTYVTNINGNVDDSLLQVNDCHTKSTTTTKPTLSSSSSKLLTLASTSWPTLSYSTHATSTLFTPNQAQSTSIGFFAKPSQSVSLSLTFPTLTTSEKSTAPPKNTVLTEDEDESDNLVAIITGVAVGVVVIIVIVIIIGVTFWRSRKRNPTLATSRNNHSSPAGDYENIYENQMAGVGTTSPEDPCSNTTKTASYYMYKSADIVHRHGNKQVQSHQHIMNTLDKNGHAKDSDFTGHVAQYYNFLEVDQIDSAPPQVSAFQSSDNKEEMGSTYENAIDNADGNDVVKRA